ncbi:Acyl carrier protein [bioreactor metagenome]|uniref:Acyl carrier protein n=1 Tax=bioreactor metagenome TaxID=1076179 RepID=A0A645I6P4_9ZZZZ
MNENFEKVAKVLAEYKEIDPSEITIDTTFEDLGFDSLDIVEIVMNLEEVFELELEMNESLVDVKSLIAYIESLQA